MEFLFFYFYWSWLTSIHSFLRWDKSTLPHSTMCNAHNPMFGINALLNKISTVSAKHRRRIENYIPVVSSIEIVRTLLFLVLHFRYSFDGRWFSFAFSPTILFVSVFVKYQVGLCLEFVQYFSSLLSLHFLIHFFARIEAVIIRVGTRACVNKNILFSYPLQQLKRRNLHSSRVYKEKKRIYRFCSTCFQLRPTICGHKSSVSERAHTAPTIVCNSSFCPFCIFVFPYYSAFVFQLRFNRPPDTS